MQLKAGQLIKNRHRHGRVLQIGLVTRVRQTKPEFVPQATIYWLYYSISTFMVGETTEIDTRQIVTDAIDPKDHYKCNYEIFQDEGGQPAAP